MDDSLIRDYLLGNLPDADRDAIGARALSDPDFHARICDIENDLLDSCARGHLHPNDDAKLRRYLHATGQMHRLQFAYALFQHQRNRRAWLRYAAIAAGAIFAVSLAWFANSRRPLPTPIATSTPTPAPTIARIATFSLTAGAVRDSAAIRRIQIPPNTDSIELQLERDEFPNFRDIEADLKTAAGLQISRITQPASTFRLLLPRTLLSPGRHELALTGITATGRRELINYYYFQIE